MMILDHLDSCQRRLNFILALEDIGMAATRARAHSYALIDGVPMHDITTWVPNRIEIRRPRSCHRVIEPCTLATTRRSGQASHLAQTAPPTPLTVILILSPSNVFVGRSNLACIPVHQDSDQATILYRLLRHKLPN